MPENASRFSYDVVRYVTPPLAQAHPDRLSTLAFLHGMSPAPPDRCRILELGCGEGGHIIPLAALYPESRFIGVDLSAEAVRRAVETSEALGLANIRFEEADILDVGPEYGEFDCVIAHGVYSWVPEPVRDRILRICRENLAPEGVAYVSYNTYPGCRIREMLRDMLLFEAGEVENPAARMEQAYRMLNLLADSDRPVLVDEVGATRERQPWQIFHDDLASEFHPVYFHQFAAHAARRRLQFLAEAQYPVMQLFGLKPQTQQTIATFAAGDVIREQQYLDFLEMRRFRQTLLCRSEIALERPPDPARVLRLWAATTAERVADDEFKGPRGASMKTQLEFALRVMGYLADRKPLAVRVTELEEAAGVDPATLAGLVAQLHAAGMVELHSCPSLFTLEPGERPRAFSVARLQAARGEDIVTTMRHASLEVEDEKARAVLLALDGEHTREELAATFETTVEDLAIRLEAVARLGLLEA